MKKSKVLLIPSYVTLAGLLAGILVISVREPQNNLIPWQMGLGVLVCTIAFLGAVYLWNKVYDRIRVIEKFYPFALAGAGLLLYFVCCAGGNRIHAIADYTAVYQTALEIAEGREISFPEYFGIYSNNIKPALILSLFFRISRVMRLNEFYLTLAVSVASVLGSAWAVGVLLEKEQDCRWRFPVLLMTMLCLPVYVCTGSFYTDTMSFGMGVIALAFLKKSRGYRGKAGWGFVVAAAFVTVYGSAWKITALIPLIAGGCVLVVHKSWRRWKRLFTYLGICLAMAACLQLWAGNHKISENVELTENPISSWIAIGMSGDGSYLENREFVNELNALTTKQDKKVFTREYMREHLSEAFSGEHIARKIQNNFAGGGLGCRDYLYEKSDGTFLWELMAAWGKYYWRTSQISFCYMGTIYAVVLAGSVLTLVRLEREKELLPWKLLADISVLGMILFLMLWESNNRQLYNQLPILLTGLFLNASELCDGWKGVNKRLRRKQNEKI